MTAGERLAAARRRLDQRSGTILLERVFEIRDGLELLVPQPLRFQRWNQLDAAAECRGEKFLVFRLFRVCRGLQPTCERFRSMEAEHPTAARHRVEAVRELRLNPGRFVEEGQRRNHAGSAVDIPTEYFSDWISTPVSSTPPSSLP